MVLENVPCNMCGSGSSRLLFEKRDPISHSDFRVVACKECGLTYVNPRPPQEEMKKYYQDNYYSNRFDENAGPSESTQSVGTLLYTFWWRWVSRYYPARVLKAEKRICNRYLPGKGKLLDIGCANGDFLKVMQDEGYDVCGFEFSDNFINKYGLNILKGTLLDAPYSADHFDLVTMWAVLEHVSDPVGYLKEIKRILKPGGKVIFLVPNLKSIPFGLCYKDDIPRHLYLFSPSSIKKMLKCSQFTLQKIIHSNAIFYGGVRGCVIDFVLRMLMFDPQKINEYNKPILELLAKKELGLGKYGLVLLSLIDALTSVVITPLLCILRYNGIVIVVAEK